MFTLEKRIMRIVKDVSRKRRNGPDLSEANNEVCWQMKQ